MAKSLKVKIFVLIIATLLISIGTLAYFVSGAITNNITENITANSAALNYAVRDNIDNFLKEKGNMLIALSAAEEVKNRDHQAVEKLFNVLIQKNESFINIYFCNTEGKLDVLVPYTELDSSFDGRTRQWYKAAESTGRLSYSDAYIDLATGAPVITLSCPVKNDEGVFQGVLAVDMSLSYLTELVNNQKVGNTGFIYVTDKSGKLVAHPDDEMLKQSADLSDSEYVKKALAGEDGLFSDENKLVYYSQIPTTGWGLFVEQHSSEAYAVRDAILKQILNVACGVVVLVLLISAAAVSKLSSIVKSLCEGVKRYADGDFTSQINVKSSSELGLLAADINAMGEKLRTLISDINTTSQSLAAHSQQLAASNEEVSATMQEVASTTSEINATAEANYQSAVNSVEETTQTAVDAQQGIEAVERLIKQNNEVNEFSTEINSSLNRLTSMSTQIGTITAAISGIAEQTNLLALNAAIEAARAGEHGRGFAVVADEVRKLAEQSAASTNEINQIVDQVQSAIAEIDALLQATDAMHAKSVELAQNAGDALGNIQQAVNCTIEVVKEMAAGIKQTGEGMEQVAASNEQVSSAIQQMNSSAQELAELANTLSTAVQKFKI